MNIYKHLTKMYLLRHKQRTILTIIGISFTVALITAIGTFLASFIAQDIRNAKEKYGSYHMEIRATTNKELHLLQSHPQIERVGIAEKERRIVGPNSQTFYLQTIDTTTYQLLPFHTVEESRKKGVIIEQWVAVRLGKKVKAGDPIVYQDEKGTTQTVHIQKIVENMSQVKKDTTPILYQLGHPVSTNATAFVEVKEGGNIAAVKQDIMGIGGDKVFLNQNLLDSVQTKQVIHNNNTNEVILFNILLALPILLANVILIYNAFRIGIAQRVQYIALLRTVGATKRQIHSMIFYEATIIGGIAVPLGILIGIVGVWMMMGVFKVITPTSSSFLVGDIMVPIQLLIVISLVSFISIYISVWLLSSFSGRISPLIAIRQNYHIAYKRKRRKKRKIQFNRFFKMETVMAYRNVRRSKRSTNVIVSLLVISIILFVSLMGFLRFISHLDQEFKNEKNIPNFSVYPNEENQNEGIGSLVKELQRYVGIEELGIFAKGLEVKALLPSTDGGNTTVRVGREKYTVVNITAAPILKENEKWMYERIPSLKTEPLLPHEVIVMDDAYETLSVRKGDILRLVVEKKGANRSRYKEEETYTVTVRDVLKGPSSFIFAHHSYFQDAAAFEINKVDIYAKGSKEIEGYFNQKRLEYPNLNFDNKMESDTQDTNEKLQLYILMYVFMSTIVIISAVNIINTIMINLLVRQKEFAILQSLGMSKQHVRRMITKEGHFYGYLGVLIGSGSMAVICLVLNMSFWDLIVLSGIGAFGTICISTRIAIRLLVKDQLFEALRNE